MEWEGGWEEGEGKGGIGEGIGEGRAEGKGEESHTANLGKALYRAFELEKAAEDDEGGEGERRERGERGERGEQRERGGRAVYGGGVDVFSLGVVLFELITPFQTFMERAQVSGNIENFNLLICWTPK